LTYFSEKLSFEFNKFCPAGSEFFHTKRERERERERDRERERERERGKMGGRTGR
jgi:hypothetical protein